MLNAQVTGEKNTISTVISAAFETLPSVEYVHSHHGKLAPFLILGRECTGTGKAHTQQRTQLKLFE